MSDRSDQYFPSELTSHRILRVLTPVLHGSLFIAHTDVTKTIETTKTNKHDERHSDETQPGDQPDRDHNTWHHHAWWKAQKRDDCNNGHNRSASNLSNGRSDSNLSDLQ